MLIQSRALRSSLFSVIITAVVLVLAGGTKVNAQSSNVNAEICNATDTPIVTVISPQSDSTTDVPQVSLTGTTVRTTQLDIFINGVYSQSIAIDPSNTFSTSLSFNEGTNTVKFNAYYSCNQQVSVSEIVVTYEPKVTPSNGNDSSTTVLPPGEVAPGVISSSDSEEPINDQEQTLPERIEENLGIGQKPSGSFYTDFVIPVRSWISLVLGFLLAVVAVMPPFHLAWLFDAFGWKNKIGKNQQIIFRFIAAVLAMLFATILQL